jgi:putative SOS response-associated peptidase YedK
MGIPSRANRELIPFAEDRSLQPKRSTSPSCRQAFKKRRCLIPLDGFYEWKKVGGGKIPYSIQMKDDSPFVFAGLWDGWKDRAKDEWIRTCTIITEEPNDLVREIHTRMPELLAGNYIR